METQSLNDKKASAQQTVLERPPYRLFPPEVGYLGYRSAGTWRFRQHAEDYLCNLSYANKPCGVPMKYWDVLHFGRFRAHGYRMGRPGAIKARIKGRFSLSDSPEIQRQKGRVWTRSEFDWHLASALASAGWSWDQFSKLYADYANGLNVFHCLIQSQKPGMTYLHGKYQRAIRKLQQEPDARRVIMGKFLHILLEKRRRLELTNGQISTLLGILYARQRIAGTAVNLSMREISLIANVDLATVSRSVKVLTKKWLRITREADLARGNQYTVCDEEITELYSNCFGTQDVPSHYLTANCLVPLSDSVFVQKGIGLDGYLMVLKLGISGGKVPVSDFRHHLGIESRKLTHLLEKMESAGLIACSGQMVLVQNESNWKAAAETLNVAGQKLRLNLAYQYQHKIHRLKLYAYGLRKLELGNMKQFALTPYQTKLQERFRKVELKRVVHPREIIAPLIQRLSVDTSPDYRSWLHSGKAKLLRQCIAYIRRTGSYAVYAEDRPTSDSVVWEAVLSGNQRYRVAFLLPEELKLDDTDLAGNISGLCLEPAVRPEPSQSGGNYQFVPVP